ncbi:MAG: rRNA (guanine527-N7)-methyltransferase, partial [Clostridiales bacterium]|nr:rRNA (guanine527-N7)-methyltransferase [Clostridiales bacterium]
MEDVRAFLRDEALRCGISLDDEAVDRFMAYKDMLIEWNERINLTSITDDMGIIIKHFIDSLLCCGTGVIRPDARLMDIGTGA